MAGGLGGLFSGLYGLFGEQDPQDAAWPYLNKIPGMLNNTYQPWINAGMGALGGMNQYQTRGNQAGDTLMGQYGQMINDPSGLINRLGAGFQQSPGYAFQTSQALGAANRAAAAGGMAGSPQEQQQIAGVTNQLANQDYYNYLNQAKGLYGQGIAGLQGTEGMGLNANEDIFNQGASAAHDLAQSLGSTYMSQANLGYQGDINTNNRIGGAIGSLGSFLDPIGSYLGGQGGDSGANSDQFPSPFSDSSGGWQSGGGGSGMNMGELASLAALFF